MIARMMLPLHITSVFKQRFKLHMFCFSFFGLSPVWLLSGPCNVSCHLGHYKFFLIDWLIDWVSEWWSVILHSHEQCESSTTWLVSDVRWPGGTFQPGVDKCHDRAATIVHAASAPPAVTAADPRASTHSGWEGAEEQRAADTEDALWNSAAAGLSVRPPKGQVCCWLAFLCWCI